MSIPQSHDWVNRSNTAVHRQNSLAAAAIGSLWMCQRSGFHADSPHCSNVACLPDSSYFLWSNARSLF